MSSCSELQITLHRLSHSTFMRKSRQLSTSSNVKHAHCSLVLVMLSTMTLSISLLEDRAACNSLDWFLTHISEEVCMTALSSRLPRSAMNKIVQCDLRLHSQVSS